jgi:antitoxin ParD1/3/4
MATTVHLTPALERFVRNCVKSGRFVDASEVVRSGLRLLAEAEERHRQFQAMLREAELEADRDGAHNIESVLAEVDRIIDETNR